VGEDYIPVGENLILRDDLFIRREAILSGNRSSTGGSISLREDAFFARKSPLAGGFIRKRGEWEAIRHFVTRRSTSHKGT